MISKQNLIFLTCYLILLFNIVYFNELNPYIIWVFVPVLWFLLWKDSIFNKQNFKKKRGK